MKIFRICFCQQGFTTKAYASKLYLFTWGKKRLRRKLSTYQLQLQKKQECVLIGGRVLIKEIY